MTVEIKEVPAVRRLARLEAAVARHSNGFASVWRDPPNVRNRSCARRYEIDPLSIARPHGDSLHGGFGGQSAQVPAIRSDEIDVGVAADSCFERDPCAVRGPFTNHGSSRAECRELPKSAPIAFSDPHLRGSRTERHERNPTSVWRESGRTLDASRIQKGPRLEGVIHQARLEIHQLKVDVAGDRLKRKACRLPWHWPRDRRINSRRGDIGNRRSSSGCGAVRVDPPQPTGCRLVDRVDNLSTIGRPRQPVMAVFQFESRRGSPPDMGTTYRSAIPTFSKAYERQRVAIR